MKEWPNREWQVVGPEVWECTERGLVDVYLNGRLYRRGLVDDVMLDASGFWLAAEGAYLREYIARGSGYHVLKRGL